MIKAAIFLTTFVILVLGQKHNGTKAPSPLGNDLNIMLQFISDWSPKDNSWTYQTPVCQWAGVTCDSDGGAVTGFYAGDRGLTGTFNESNLPATLTFLNLRVNQLTGTLVLTALPSNLALLELSNNQFTGTPILSALPAALASLYLNNNQLYGTPSLAGLPANLTTLNLGANYFTGTPLLNSLPAALTALYLNVNQFSGTPILSDLPPNLAQADLTQNDFCGSTAINIPCADILSDGACSGTTLTFRPC